MPSMSQEIAEQYANVSRVKTSIEFNTVLTIFTWLEQKVKGLAKKATDATRDLNPEDKLKNLRIRTKTKEMLVSFATDSVVVIIQKWSHYTG